MTVQDSKNRLFDLYKRLIMEQAGKVDGEVERMMKAVREACKCVKVCEGVEGILESLDAKRKMRDFLSLELRDATAYAIDTRTKSVVELINLTHHVPTDQKTLHQMLLVEATALKVEIHALTEQIDAYTLNFSEREEMVTELLMMQNLSQGLDAEMQGYVDSGVNVLSATHASLCTQIQTLKEDLKYLSSQ